MKKIVAFILTALLLCLLTACTDGGNVSDSTDGMISESTTAAEPQTEPSVGRTEQESSSDILSESNDMTGESDDLIGGSETGDPTDNASGARAGMRRY